MGSLQRCWHNPLFKKILTALMSRTQTKYQPLTSASWLLTLSNSLHHPHPSPPPLLPLCWHLCGFCCGCTGNVTCRVQSVSSVGNTHIMQQSVVLCVSTVCVSYSQNPFFHQLKMWRCTANSSRQPPVSEELHSDLLTFCHASQIYLFNIPNSFTS